MSPGADFNVTLHSTAAVLSRTLHDSSPRGGQALLSVKRPIRSLFPGAIRTVRAARARRVARDMGSLNI
jgi:hypothetical protein